MEKVRVLDVVRTPKGNLAVVNEISTMKEASLSFSNYGVQEHNAWWSPKELTYLFNVADMVDVLEDDTIKELIRLRKGERNEG